MNTVICFGEALIDFLPCDENPQNYRPIAGGAPANVAVAISKLGGNSLFVGGLSRDPFGQMLKKDLESYGVDISHSKTINDKNTAVVLVALDSDNERSFSFYRHDSADLNFSKNDFNEQMFEAANAFHFCSNTLTTPKLHEATLRGIELARRHSQIVSFDVNLRASLWSDETDYACAITELIALSDIVKFSREELEDIAQKLSISDEQLVESSLNSGAKIVVITDGGNSITLHNSHGQHSVPVPNISPVDTTGAGDAFIGALLYKITKDGKNWQALLNDILQLTNYIRFASICGALTCENKGAFPSLPTHSEVASHPLFAN